MKRGALLILPVIMAASALPGRAATGVSLSPEQLAVLDRKGYFTPAFKTAVTDLVNVKQAIVDATAEQKKLNLELPGVQKDAAEAAAKKEDLQKQLDALDHTDETDFVELKKIMDNPDAKPEEQLIQAQAYVWAYTASPHKALAQQFLSEVQKKIADAAKAAADAEAAKAAARAELIRRAQIKDLKVDEWRDLLLNMSQEDLIKFMGMPDSGDQDRWVYPGAWTEDAITHQKVGLEVSFNAGRVINVVEAPH